MKSEKLSGFGCGGGKRDWEDWATMKETSIKKKRNAQYSPSGVIQQANFQPEASSLWYTSHTGDTQVTLT